MDEREFTIRVNNDSSWISTIVLEPWGEIFPIGPGETRIVQRTGKGSAAVTIDVNDRELKIWEEGDGLLRMEHE